MKPACVLLSMAITAVLVHRRVDAPVIFVPIRNTSVMAWSMFVFWLAWCVSVHPMSLHPRFNIVYAFALGGASFMARDKKHYYPIIILANLIPLAEIQYVNVHALLYCSIIFVLFYSRLHTQQTVVLPSLFVCTFWVLTMPLAPVLCMSSVLLTTVAVAHYQHQQAAGVVADVEAQLQPLKTGVAVPKSPSVVIQRPPPSQQPMAIDRHSISASIAMHKQRLMQTVDSQLIAAVERPKSPEFVITIVRDM